ncbi:protein FAM210B, mitochondrial [Cyclopterus lumpus]|uniref:Family with sequence similarity 210 member B n=1 Tax=Cyclopterus lumpus TaxID=8103 RepID=A0A8C2ZGH6_CYCLU|nr:protein FAM210B, mitochondrial [Cyclopterus lumpus]
MLLSRLSAAALDQAFKSTGSFLVQVRATRLRDVTLTLRKGYTFQRRRCFCVSVVGVDATLAQLGKRQPDRRLPLENRNPSCALDRRHLDRVATEPANRSERVQSGGGIRDNIAQPLACANHSARREPVGNVLFTGDWRRFSGLRSAGAMQTRALSTKKKTDAGEEPAANNKGAEQNLKEASSTSSSIANAPGEPEAEGGKPNKTQQLKKVFKEYGAVGVSFHIGISLMSLGMFYLLISSGIDMAAVLCKVGFSEAVVRSKMAAGTSTFVLAYAIHKLFAPVRISITLVSVPLIVRYFRKTGHFKPPTPAP